MLTARTKEWMDQKILLQQLQTLGQCWYESIESRIGACDGGQRCTKEAVVEIKGVPYCAKHGGC